MRALRYLVICCLLVALPLAGIAATFDCCPHATVTGPAGTAAAGGEHHHAHDAHQSQTTDLADQDCADQLCALHCAHAPALTSLVPPLPSRPPAALSFLAPPEHAALATAPPSFRPPIPDHC